MTDYSSFIADKMSDTPGRGLDPSEIDLAGHLFEHQRVLVNWALIRGRAAIFADTGLGKTSMQLDWAKNVSRHGRVLILTPLAVAAQTVREGERFGVSCSFSQADNGDRIVVTNYEHLEKFNPSQFAGVVIDESSILKNYAGAFRNRIIEAFSATRFRLACTATPAPNDHMELGNHAEFLGLKSRTEMLAEYFVHDGGSTQSWRLKGHAQDVFWKWVSSWGAMIRRPSDLGFDDGAFDLPSLNMHEIVIPITHQEAWKEGFLFAPDAVTLSDQRATRRATIDKRVAECVRLADNNDPCLIWCELNDEADAITKAIPDAVQVSGSDSPEDKIDRLLGFADGKYRVLVSKPKVAGFGMNWQHCSRVVFAGASNSFEQTYQAIRRCWRFGQKRPVDAFVIRAENEEAIIRNYRRKEADAARMQSALLMHTREFQNTALGVTRREWNAYDPTQNMRTPRWIQTTQEEKR